MKSNYHKFISISSLIALIGFILSGPIAFFTVNLLHYPQSEWESPKIFGINYSTILDLPDYFGLLLFSGTLILAACHYLNYKQDDRIKFQLLIALGLTVIFVVFSLSHPLSLWINEMLGYGILGIAIWFMAGYYHNKAKIIRVLLITSGIISLAGIVMTNINVRWTMTFGVMVSYSAWNILMIVLMILIYRNSKKNISELQ